MQYQMPPELTKEERAMLNELPPLPRSDYTDNGGFGQDRALALFTGSQMRSYALEAVRLDRERCARIVETTPAEAFCTVMHQAQLLKARETFAAAIRSAKP